MIGADGVRSWTRRRSASTSRPKPPGWASGGSFAPRPASVTRTDLFYGGAVLHRRLLPDRRGHPVRLPRRGRAGPLRADPGRSSSRSCGSCRGAYHGPWDDIRATLTDPARVNYTWFETHVLDAPWNRGRVVLIGDAAHTCPPTLAQGAAQALEDAAVLAELLLAADRSTTRCGTRSPPAGYDRAKTVVDASVQLGQWLLDDERGDVPGLMARVADLAAPRLSPALTLPRSTDSMTERLITHLRHVDLAVPDYDRQLDFYTDHVGADAESHRHRHRVPGRRGLARAVRRCGCARPPRSAST